METAIEQIDIEELDYMANPHSTFHFYSAMTTQMTDFLKLRLEDISTLSRVQMDESTPVQPSAMDAETKTTTDQMLTDIPEEISANQSTTLDVTPQEPTAMAVPPALAVDPPIFLATPAIPNGKLWSPLSPCITSCRRHPVCCSPNPDMLKKKIQNILLPQLAPAFAVPQVAQPPPVIAQAAVQLPAALPPSPPVPQPLPPASLLPPTGPMDVQTPQAPSKSAPALDRHGQPILRPGR
uniref:Uncharacterized protein n=1 Tax=Romanomermis culicivorax TaxID=13658 RepID=A0A915IAM9_ROMCU